MHRQLCHHSHKRLLGLNEDIALLSVWPRKMDMEIPRERRGGVGGGGRRERERKSKTQEALGQFGFVRNSSKEGEGDRQTDAEVI